MSADAKKISELQETVNVSNRDYLVINEFDSTKGYELTKKVTTLTLALFIHNFVSKLLSSEYKLSALSQYDVNKLLNDFMTTCRGNNALPANSGGNSLALSTVSDLNLGNLSSMNYEDLQLERFAEKTYATVSHIAGQNEYIKGIILEDGKVTNIIKGRIADEVPIDDMLNSVSDNPVLNSVIKAALDTKMNKADGSMTHNAIEGNYVAGFKQLDGKIIDVKTFKLPKLPIDDFLSEQSENPVQNKIVTNKINQIYDRITAETSLDYIKCDDANSYLVANNGEYVKGIRQYNGKIVEIEKGKNADIVAGVIRDLNSLREYVDDLLALLKKLIDSTYVKLSTGATLTITGPVVFSTVVKGTVTNALLADKAKWS